MKFNCDKCGLCCKNLKKNPIYSALDRGDGVCKYLEGNLCSIYENRPILCNIDKSYELYFKEEISREMFYNINYEACRELKKNKEE